MAERAPRRMLTQIQTFELMKEIDRTYATLELTDREFAEKFSAEHFHVTEGNVQGARNQRGIEATRNKHRGEAAKVAAEEVLERLGRIERLLIELLGRGHA